MPRSHRSSLSKLQCPFCEHIFPRGDFGHKCPKCGRRLQLAVTEYVAAHGKGCPYDGKPLSFDGPEACTCAASQSRQEVA